MRTNTKYRSLLSIMLLAFFLLCNTGYAFAAGSTSIKVSQKSAEVGDNVTVTVSGSESGTISVRYNNNVMELSSVASDSYTTNGNIITFTGTSASITFSAIAEGSGDVMVSSDTLSGSSTSIAVSGGTQDSTQTEEEAADTQQTEADGDFMIDGVAYVLSERFSEGQIPQGFSRKSIEFSSGTYRELQNDFMTLVYLKPASDTKSDGKFYIYNSDDNSVSPFNTLGSADNYIIIKSAAELPAETLQETTFNVDDAAYTGYQPEGIQNEFYFVYGTNMSGEDGWYQYDSVALTIQRANTDLLQSYSSDTEEAGDSETVSTSPSIGDSKLSTMFKKLNNTRTLLAILVFAAVVLLIIIVDILLFRRGRDDEDDDDEFFAEEILNERKEAEKKEKAIKEEKQKEGKSEAVKEQENDFEENEVEVLTLDDVLDDVEDDLKSEPKHKKRNGLFRRKSEDIWDLDDEVDEGTGGLPALDERSRLKKQIFRNNSAAESSESKVDLIDFNDL